MRMQVNCATSAYYLESGLSHSSTRTLRASVSRLGQKSFVSAGRKPRVEDVRRPTLITSQKNPSSCRSGGATAVDFSRSTNVAGSANSFRAVTETREVVVAELSSGGGGGDGGDGGAGGGGRGDSDGGDGEPGENHNVVALLLAFCGITEGMQRWYRMPSTALAGLALFLLQQQAALALSGTKEDARTGTWEVKGGRWKYLVKHPERDEFVVETVKNSEEEALAYEEELVARQKGETVNGDVKENGVKLGVDNIVSQFVELSKQLLLPDGYPGSVTDDYMEYTLWRMGQVIASQISGVLTTQVPFFFLS